METFSVGSAVRFGWETFKKRPWFFIGIVVLYCIISWVIGFIAGLIGSFVGDSESMAFVVVSNVISFLLSIFVSMGLIAFLLKAHDNPDAAEIADFWHPQDYWNMLGVTVLTMIAVVGGLILLIVPGIIFSLMFMFGTYLVIDRKMTPIDAMKESMRITKGHKGELFLLGLATIGIVILGTICLIVGTLVALPVVMLAQVYAYRTLSKMAAETVPVTTAPNTSAIA